MSLKMDARLVWVNFLQFYHMHKCFDKQCRPESIWRLLRICTAFRNNKTCSTKCKVRNYYLCKCILNQPLIFFIIWALTRENLSGFAKNNGTDQPVQSDQRLCYSLFGKYHIYILLQSEFLAILCRLGDWFEFCFVRNPEDRFCHVEAHINWMEDYISLKMV